MQDRYFATFGSGHLENYDVPGGATNVMLVSPVGLTEAEFRLVVSHRFDNKYCATYPLTEAHRMHINYGMVQYTLCELKARQL